MTNRRDFLQPTIGTAINAALKNKAVQDALTVVGLIPLGCNIADQLKSSQSSWVSPSFVELP